MNFTPLLDAMSAEFRLKYEQLVTAVEPKLQEKKVRLIIGLTLTAILVAIGFFVGWVGSGEIKYDSLETPGAVSFARVWLSLTFVGSMIYFIWITVQYKVWGTIAKSSLKTLDSMLSNEPDIDNAGLTALYNEQTHTRVNNTLGTLFALLNMFTVLVVIGEVYRDSFRIFLMLLLLLFSTGIVWMLDSWTSTHRWRETLEKLAVYVYAAAIALLAFSLLLTFISPEAYSWFKAKQYQGTVAIKGENQEIMTRNRLNLEKQRLKDGFEIKDGIKKAVTKEAAKTRIAEIDLELKELEPENPKSVTERVNDTNPNPVLLTLVNWVLLLILGAGVVLGLMNRNVALPLVVGFICGVLWLLAQIFIPLGLNASSGINRLASQSSNLVTPTQTTGNVCHRDYPSKSNIDDEQINFAGTPISLPDLPDGSTLTLDYSSGEVVINNGLEGKCWTVPVWGESWKKMTRPEYRAAFHGQEAKFTNPNTQKEELINVAALYVQTTDNAGNKTNYPFMEQMGGQMTFTNKTGGTLKAKLRIQDPPENDKFRVGNVVITYKIEGGIEGS